MEHVKWQFEYESKHILIKTERVTDSQRFMTPSKKGSEGRDEVLWGLNMLNAVIFLKLSFFLFLSALLSTSTSNPSLHASRQWKPPAARQSGETRAAPRKGRIDMMDGV